MKTIYIFSIPNLFACYVFLDVYLFRMKIIYDEIFPVPNIQFVVQEFGFSLILSSIGKINIIVYK